MASYLPASSMHFENVLYEAIQMRFQRLRISASLAWLTLFSVAATPVVFAGSSGQQITVYTGPATRSVKITGDNQGGVETHQTLETPASPIYDAGYWWERSIQITSYSGTQGSGSDLGTVNCSVPVSQSGNWYDCFAY